MTDDDIHFFEPIDLVLRPINDKGFILDIGGGGEGVVGRLHKQRVVSIDLRMDELVEAPAGPLKIQMDARDLKFPGDTFSAATAFFSMMYFRSVEDHRRVFEETHRVLEPGGLFHIWDADVSMPSNSTKRGYAIQVRGVADGHKVTAAYGVGWPPDTRDVPYYHRLAEDAGFRHVSTETVEAVFHLVLRK
jgi:SAM-dependent methyltransferase